MIFSDLIFVFAFLPIYFALSFSCREGWTKNLFSAAASILFIIWGRQWYYALIIVPVFLIYLLGLISKGKKPAAASGVFFAVLYAVPAVIALGQDITLNSAILSVGMILFMLRAASYMDEISKGEAPERDLLALSVYLFSFENMLIAPLSRYGAVKERLKLRRLALSKMSEGISSFIFGFARVAVFGLAFDKVRLAAVSGGVFPWLNAIILVLATVCETYVVAAGVLEMSRGLGLMNGFAPSGQISAFIPKRRVTEHIFELWGSLPEFVKGLGGSAEQNVLLLAAASVITGVFIGTGAYVGAFFGIILMAVTIEQLSDQKRKISDRIFTAALLSAAFLTLSAGSAGGYAELFGAFNVSKYDFDISYRLFEQLDKSLVLMAVGTVLVSPLYRLAAVWIRQKKQESEALYGAIRTAETVLCAALLVIGIMASL